ncbi:MAG: ATP-binding cassette domain-containing protein [Oscillospiraceae bacterium]|nr:ATP-binding cassette domain-containing protein [Oscillospiraceae bacterium]
MILKAEKITKEFIREMKHTNRFAAVQETDFTLESGTFAILTGRSGSGKSTFLNMLSGLMLPTSGNILLNDTDMYTLSDKDLSRFRNQHIGVIPQGQTALHSLNVLENISLPYTLYGEDAPEQEAVHLMEQLGIADLQKAMPSELSGGELRRMAIARAFLRKPEIILADEPTSDLDDENTEIVFTFLQEAARAGAAVLAVTHETDAAQYADRLFRMDAGVLTEQFI